MDALLPNPDSRVDINNYSNSMAPPVQNFLKLTNVTAAFFLEFWKRYQITLAFLWSKADFLDAQEPARPEYAVTCEEDDVRYLCEIW